MQKGCPNRVDYKLNLAILTTAPYWFIGNNFLEIVNKLKRYSTTPITNTTCDVISRGIFHYMDR